MKKQKTKIGFKFLLIYGVIMLVVGLISLLKNTAFGIAMIMGGFVLVLVSLLKLSKNKRVKNTMASAWWFLLAAAIFGFAGIRYIVKQDTVGAIINLVVAALFLAAFIGHSIKKK